jgi:hypothetical protein
MYDIGKIHTVMWLSKAGCIGLDEKTCLDRVERLCTILDNRYTVQGVFFEANVAKAKSELPADFRRSFVKALVQVDTKSAWLGLVTDITALLMAAAFFFFLHTETGRRFLARTPPDWMSSTWFFWVVILGCLIGMCGLYDKISKIASGPKRTKELEQLLL